MQKSKKSNYSELLKDPRWQKLRLRVFDRDEWRCRACHSKEKTLHAHHLFYSREAEGPWDYELSDILTLCDDCHENEHQSFPWHGPCLLNAAANSGFVLSADIAVLHDMIITLGHAMTDETSLELLITMIKCRAEEMEGATIK